MALAYKTLERSVPLSSATSPLEQGLWERQRESRASELDAKQKYRRAEDRLAVAAQRHRAVISRIQQEQAHRAAVIEHQTANAEEEARQVAVASRYHVTQAQAQTVRHDENKASHDRIRADAVEKAAQQRELAEQHQLRAERDYNSAVEAANRVIGETNSATRAELDEKERHRERIKAKCHQDIVAAQKDSEDRASAARTNATMEMLRTEVTRHRAGLTVALAHESAQALRTIAQEKVLKTADAGAANAAILARESHEVRKACDEELAEQMRRSAKELQAAHDRCQQIKEELQQEASEYKQRMHEIEGEAEANATDAERQIQSLEGQQLQLFSEGHRLVKEAEAMFRGRRDTSEGQMEAIYNRLKEVQEETKNRVDKILADWREGNRNTETQIRQLEKDGQEAIEAMQQDVKRHIDDFTKQYDQTQKAGARIVATLERKSNKVVNSTQPEVDTARYPEDKAAHAARSALQDMRLLPEELQADADKKIEVLEAQADAEAQRLFEEGEAAAAAGKRASKRARDEEEWLQRETADAWARIRAGSAMNSHGKTPSKQSRRWPSQTVTSTCQ